MRSISTETVIEERRRRRRSACALLVPALALGGLAVAAAPASAAFVELANGRITYVAAPGEANDVTFDGAATSIRVVDAGATIEPGHDCAARTDGSVLCGDDAAEIDQLAVYVRDGADRVVAETLLPLVQLFGGKGDDVMHSGSSSGNRHVLVGGSGADELTTSTNDGGHSTIDGGLDDDAISLLEGGLFDFAGGRGDDVLTIRGLIGPSSRLDGERGDDTYVFAGPADDPQGGLPLNLIAPGPGVDTFSLDDATGLVDLASCAGCVENISGSAFGDALLGDDEVNSITGGDGDDVLDPRGGSDTVAGDGGDDVVLTRDGEPDTVACGDGVDRVLADPTDTVDYGSCESVRTG